jgi:hypothetical protein
MYISWYYTTTVISDVQNYSTCPIIQLPTFVGLFTSAVPYFRLLIAIDSHHGGSLLQPLRLRQAIRNVYSQLLPAGVYATTVLPTT